MITSRLLPLVCVLAVAFLGAHGVAVAQPSKGQKAPTAKAKAKAKKPKVKIKVKAKKATKPGAARKAKVKKPRPAKTAKVKKPRPAKAAKVKKPRPAKTAKVKKPRHAKAAKVKIKAKKPRHAKKAKTPRPAVTVKVKVEKGKAPARTPGPTASPAPAARDPRSRTETAARKLRKKARTRAAQNAGISISLLRGAAALTDDPTVYRDLGLAYQAAGQFDLASHELRRYASLEPNRLQAQRALSRAGEIDDQPRGFGEGGFRVIPASEDAVWAFKEGHRHLRARRYAEAVLFFQAAMLLNPGVPGPYRMLGAAYGRIGARAKRDKFFIEYLRVRPDGPIADKVRKILGKTGTLGYLTILADFPCDVVINGRELYKKLTPIKRLAVPPGGYSISLGSTDLHGQWNIRDRVVVESGKEAVFRLPLGILRVELKPWARITVDGKYVGSYEEIGLRAGDYRVHLETADGAKQKDVTVTIRPGKKFVVKSW